MEKKPKPRGLLLIRKVRPRYNKLLIPALIVSLIIAVILILILRKYFIKPLLEEEGLLETNRSVVMMKCENPYKDFASLLFPDTRVQSILSKEV